MCRRVYVSIEMSEHLKGRGCREEQIEPENKFVKSDESFPESFVEPTGKKVSRLVFFGREVMMATTFTKVPNQYPDTVILIPSALSFPYLFHPTFLCPLSIISI